MEITWPDLEFYANSISTSILSAATKMADLASKNGVTIIALASFQNFEGHLSPLNDRLAKATSWLVVARELGAEYLQMPSTYIRGQNNDRKVISVTKKKSYLIIN
ncbi:hypothetical protein LSUE1_G009675, partial [Lachnellula suecica]